MKLETARQKINLFLSAVSAEFRVEREALAEQLRKTHFVREQSDFAQGPGTLLEKLESYIRDECHAVIFLTGTRYGAEPPAHEAAPSLDGEIQRYSYTQWEYIFAVRHNKARFVFTPAPQYQPATSVDDKEPEDPALTALQKVFIEEKIRASGKDRSPFHSLDDLKDQIRALNLEALAYAHYHHLPLHQENPYVGLRRFEERDKTHFYGRNTLLDDLLPLVQREPLLLVTGHSGSGKSSVLRAGLIPRWRETYGNEARVILFHPSDDPFETLYETLGGSEFDIEKDERAWIKDGHPDVFHLLQERIPHLGGGKHLLIVIDQFEEMFTRIPEAQSAVADQFAAALVANHRRGTVRIVLAMRDDFYGNLERHRTLCDLLDTGDRTRRIMRPTESELRAIIEAPAASHGVGFEKDLVERILKEVRGQRSASASDERRALLPLLQFTLEELWNYEVATGSITDRILDIHSYEQIGCFAGALKKRIDGFYDQLSSERQTEVQRIFLQLVQIGEADIPVSRGVKKSDLLQSVDPELLERLINKEKLLVSGGDTVDGSGNIELAHEALIDGWGQFREWIRENQEAIRLHRRLEEDAARWGSTPEDSPSVAIRLDGKESATEDLWRGTNLQLAEAARDGEDFDRVGGLTTAARDFLIASRRAVEDEISRLQTLVARAEAGEAEARAQQVAAERAKSRAEAGEEEAKTQKAAADSARRRSQRRAVAALIFGLFALAGMLGVGWYWKKATKQTQIIENEKDNATNAQAQAERAFESAFAGLKNLNLKYSAEVLDDLQGLQTKQAKELKLQLNDQLIGQLEILHKEQPRHVETIRMLVDLNSKNSGLLYSKDTGDRCTKYMEAAISWSGKLEGNSIEDAELLAPLLAAEPIAAYYGGAPSEKTLEISKRNQPKLDELTKQWPNSWRILLEAARLNNAMVFDQGQDPIRFLKIAQDLAPLSEQSNWDYDVLNLRILAWSNSLQSIKDKSSVDLKEVEELLDFLELCFLRNHIFTLHELDSMAGGRLKTLAKWVIEPVLSSHNGDDHKDKILELLSRTQELVRYFDKQLPYSQSVYDLNGEFLKGQLSILRKQGIGLQSEETLLSSIERHRIEAASHGLTDSIAQLFSEAVVAYIESGNDREKTKAYKRVVDASEALYSLDFLGLNTTLDALSLGSQIGDLRKNSPRDDVVSLHDQLLVQLDVLFRQSGISVRRHYFQDYAKKTRPLLEKFRENGEDLHLRQKWREATDGIDPFFLKDGERSDILYFASLCAEAFVKSDEHQIGLDIWRRGASFSEAILEERPWDWYLFEAAIKINFDLAETLIRNGNKIDAQSVLKKGWQLRAFRWGHELRKDRVHWPRSGELPSDCFESERELFSRFLPPEKGGGKTMKLVVIPCNVNNEMIPLQFYILHGKNGYTGLAEQFRWISEYRGVKPPEDVVKRFDEMNTISITKKIPLVALAPLAIKGWGEDDAVLEKYISEIQLAFQKMDLPMDSIYTSSQSIKSLGKLWDIANENKVSFADLLVYVWK